MLQQRHEERYKHRHEQAAKGIEKYYSVKADLTEKQNTKSIPRGKIIRNQISKTNNERSWDRFDKNQQRNLTPQYNKLQQQQIKRKKSELEDIHSFKLEQSNVNSKYLTIKKDLKENGSEKTKKGDVHNRSSRHGLNYPENQRGVMNDIGNGTITLNEGWEYKGQYSTGLFHGYGELFHQKQIIYKGKFKYGFFHGYGKLQKCEMFNYLIPMQHIRTQLELPDLKKSHLSLNSDSEQLNWMAYMGQFKQGEVSGYGELWLNNSLKLLGNWQKGRIKKKYMRVSSEDN